MPKTKVDGVEVGVTGDDLDAIHSYALGTKSKVSEIDVTTLTESVNIKYL